MRVNVAAIVPAAGEGKRLRAQGSGLGVRKPFMLLGNKPILVHTLEILESSPSIDYILVVAHKYDKNRVSKIIKKYKIGKVRGIIAGGATRTDSVYNGLKNVDDETDIVLIHDGARPFTTEGLIEKTILGAKRYGACVCGINAISTVKEVDDKLFVISTMNRNRIFDIQTPQAFRRDIIARAYKEARRNGFNATDDARLVERLRYKVKVIDGLRFNIKITYPEDIILAEAIYENWHRIRHSSAKRE